MDFMKNHKCDLIISNNCLKINKEYIPCFLKASNKPSCSRIALQRDVEIAPKSEMIVDGKLIDHIDKDFFCLLEGSEKFMSKSGLMIAKVLVNPKFKAIPIRIANVTDKPIKNSKIQSHLV